MSCVQKSAQEQRSQYISQGSLHFVTLSIHSVVLQGNLVRYKVGNKALLKNQGTSSNISARKIYEYVGFVPCKIVKNADDTKAYLQLHLLEVPDDIEMLVITKEWKTRCSVPVVHLRPDLYGPPWLGCI